MNKIKQILLILSYLFYVTIGTEAEEKRTNMVDFANSLGSNDAVQYGSGSLFGGIAKKGEWIVNWIYEHQAKNPAISNRTVEKYANRGVRIFINGKALEYTAQVAPYVGGFSSAAGRAYEGDYSGASIEAMNGVGRAATIGYVGSAAGTAVGIWASGEAGAAAGSVVGPVGTVAGFLAGCVVAYTAGKIWDHTVSVAANTVDQEMQDLKANLKYTGKQIDYIPKEPIRSSTVSIVGDDDSYWEDESNKEKEKYKKEIEIQIKKLEEEEEKFAGNHSHQLVKTLKIDKSIQFSFGNWSIRSISSSPGMADSIAEAKKAFRKNITHFMQNFQQRFTNYYNRTHNRRGRFWADRFKSTIVEGQDALLTVIKYVDLNPVRAGIVKDPADYRHCSWGWSCGSGKQFFASTFFKHLRIAMGYDIAKEWSDEQLISEYRCEIARTISYEQRDSTEKTEEAMAQARKGESMPVRYLRRMRHISDGGIIGSKLFVQETASLFRDNKYVMKKKFSHGQTANGIDLYCYKSLRLNF